MLLAPLSEYFGRRRVYLVSWFIFTCFQIPLALAQNLQTILVCRFIQGFTGSAPLANTGGVVHDIFGVDEGGMAVGIYALSSADGPPFGNVVSGYLAQEQGWRWLFWAYVRRMIMIYRNKADSSSSSLARSSLSSTSSCPRRAIPFSFRKNQPTCANRRMTCHSMPNMNWSRKIPDICGL